MVVKLNFVIAKSKLLIRYFCTDTLTRLLNALVFSFSEDGSARL